MIPLAEAQARVRRDIQPLSIVEVDLQEARGLVLAESIATKEAIPPFANSAMDGFALKYRDSLGASPEQPLILPVAETIAAGMVASRPLVSGEVMRIMTGAPIPEGADAVIMVELTRPAVSNSIASQGTTSISEATSIELLAEVAEGNHVRPAGDDVGAGLTVLAPGEVISPAHIGVLASVGCEQVRVHQRPRVGVFSTGDELITGPALLQPGQIRDSNRPTLLALVAEAGCVPIDLGWLPDNEEEIETALRRAVGPDATVSCDVLLTSGGVSMGDFDFVKKVLSRLGDLNWMQVAIKPAKPLAFGLLMGTPIFGLPGNPVSSMVSFELFARPSLLTMMGRTVTERLTVTAVSEGGLSRRSDGKTHFQRVVVDQDNGGTWRASSAGGQGSHQLTAMARANALAVVPDGEGIQPGGSVQVMLLD